MIAQEIYDLMSKGFDDIKIILTSIDNRLRNVETDVADQYREGSRSTIANPVLAIPGSIPHAMFSIVSSFRGIVI